MADGERLWFPHPCAKKRAWVGHGTFVAGHIFLAEWWRKNNGANPDGIRAANVCTFKKLLTASWQLLAVFIPSSGAG
jgi:subtilisin family serine protease